MAGVSAIGLKLCPMATNDTCHTTDSDLNNNLFAVNPTPAFQRSPDDKKTEADVQVNVYLSATIHHNNITINSDKPINIDMNSVNNFTSSSTGHHKVWQKLFPNHYEFFRGLINESIVAEPVNGTFEEDIPRSDFLRAESDFNLTTVRTHDTDVDPCSHPEYIVFTWVSINNILMQQQMLLVL